MTNASQEIAELSKSYYLKLTMAKEKLNKYLCSILLPIKQILTAEYNFLSVSLSSKSIFPPISEHLHCPTQQNKRAIRFPYKQAMFSQSSLVVSKTAAGIISEGFSLFYILAPKCCNLFLKSHEQRLVC